MYLVLLRVIFHDYFRPLLSIQAGIRVLCRHQWSSVDELPCSFLHRPNLHPLFLSKGFFSRPFTALPPVPAAFLICTDFRGSLLGPPLSLRKHDCFAGCFLLDIFGGLFVFVSQLGTFYKASVLLIFPRLMTPMRAIFSGTFTSYRNPVPFAPIPARFFPQD